MTRAEQIILNRIHELNNRMDYECKLEVEAEVQGTYFDKHESFRRWSSMFDRKVELMDVLAEIQGCNITEVAI